MFVLFQRIWVFLMVDGFLIFLIARIAGKKLPEEKREIIKPKNKIRRQRGVKLHYYFHDERGEDQAGTIDRYPCLLGRGKNCDLYIAEQPKSGRYYLSREFIQIIEIKDGFRVNRCRKQEEVQRTLSGTADGTAFEDEVSITFEETLEIKVTKRIMLRLEKETLRTNAV